MKKYCLISFVSILFIGGLFVTSKLIVNDSYVLFNANVEALSNEESSSGILTCHNDYFYTELCSLGLLRMPSVTLSASFAPQECSLHS